LERISGVYGQVKSDIVATMSDEAEQGEAESNNGFHGGLRAGVKAPNGSTNLSQGQLNIDSPSAPKKSSEEDLDIPAFLRRQAN